MFKIKCPNCGASINMLTSNFKLLSQRKRGCSACGSQVKLSYPKFAYLFFGIYCVIFTGMIISSQYWRLPFFLNVIIFMVILFVPFFIMKFFGRWTLYESEHILRDETKDIKRTKTKFRILIVGLLLTNLVTFAFLVRAIWHDYVLWPQEVDHMAGYAAYYMASSDFRSGKIRIFQLSDKNDMKFTGRTTGPFEIWEWPCYSVLDRTSRYTAQKFVEFYNLRMQAMQKHSEKK